MSSAVTSRAVRGVIADCGKAHDVVRPVLIAFEGLPTRIMNTPPLTTDDFQTALTDRYLQPAVCLHHREELVRLLEEREVFLNVDVFMELVEQARLINAELGRLLKEQNVQDGIDLSEQGEIICAQILEWGRKLPLSLPQAVIKEAAP